MYYYKKNIRLPEGKELIIIPLGDVQGEEQLDLLDKLVQWCVREIKKGNLVFLFLTGDYFETFSPSERAKLDGAKFHETTIKDIDSMVRAKADDFIRRLMPLKNHIFILLQGHHWKPIKVGKHTMPSDQYIAEYLNADYAGDGQAVMDLLINGLPFRIHTMHGYGGGKMAGGRINKRMQMRDVILNANWYAMGHDNEKMVWPKEPLIVRDGKINYLKQYFTGVGCFQESYHLNEIDAGYAEKAAFSPACIGVVICRVAIKEQNGKKALDYHIST